MSLKIPFRTKAKRRQKSQLASETALCFCKLSGQHKPKTIQAMRFAPPFTGHTFIRLWHMASSMHALDWCHCINFRNGSQVDSGFALTRNWHHHSQPCYQGAMAQRQRVRLQIRRLGARIPLASCCPCWLNAASASWNYSQKTLSRRLFPAMMLLLAGSWFVRNCYIAASKLWQFRFNSPAIEVQRSHSLQAAASAVFESSLMPCTESAIV